MSIWLAWGDASQVETFSRSGFGDLSGQGERILLVDDEADIRRTLAQLLGDSGYEVESAASGLEALNLVAASPPDLLLLDVLMPGIGGLEVARRVRQVHPRIPIIFLSAHADAETIAAEVPHAALLRKPFMREELNLQIRRCLSGPRAAPVSPPA
ncbi:MAG: response regulator [Aquabacterium sp.]|nr:MAG: response regulator [Aquabacterium sp.]